MALQIFKDWFCCCCRDEQDTYNIYNENDETARLIPDDLEPTRSNITCDSALVDKQQQLQERLGTIVRAKEGQMVNVSSRIPFNLHNQTVLPDLLLSPDPDLSLSRSTSHSDLVQTLTQTRPDSSIPCRHPLHPSNPYPRVVNSPSQSPRSLSRAESPEREMAATIATLARPHPILNVRLVGFEDQRGRTLEREHDRDHLVGSDRTVTQSQIPPITSHNFDTPPPDNLKLHELGAISRSWGD